MTIQGVNNLKNVRIVGVQKLDTYYQCLKCAAKVTEDDDVGECLRCSMVQNLSHCHTGVMACVIVKSENNILTLRVFDKVVTAIMDNQREVTPRELLRAHPFGMHFQDGIYAPSGDPNCTVIKASHLTYLTPSTNHVMLLYHIVIIII